MGTQIFYFSGTGNSLYVAKELAQRTDATLTSVLSALKSKQTAVSANSVGFVFPVHSFSIPNMLREFLKQASFRPNTYVFAVATRGGSPCHVFEEIDGLLGERGCSLSAHFFINMPNNYLVYYDVPTTDERFVMQRETTKRILEITKVVSNRTFCKEADHGSAFETKRLFPFLSKLHRLTGYFWMKRRFYANGDCLHCGQCEKVCLSDRINARGKKVVWDHSVSCEYCFACIHYCPAKAIQIRGAKTKKKGRYHHERIGSKELASQKIW